MGGGRTRSRQEGTAKELASDAEKVPVVLVLGVQLVSVEPASNVVLEPVVLVGVVWLASVVLPAPSYRELWW